MHKGVGFSSLQEHNRHGLLAVVADLNGLLLAVFDGALNMTESFWLYFKPQTPDPKPEAPQSF